MSEYMEKVEREMQRWEHKTRREPSMPAKVSKRWQNKINSRLPERFHAVVTESVRQMVQAALVSSDYLSDLDKLEDVPLEERESIFDKRVTTYKRTAAVEGAGTGFGGVLLGVADFPLLLTIKMKFLFDAGKIYGFNVDEIEERMFLLHVFQLAFSREEKKKEVFNKIINWEENLRSLKGEAADLRDLDWRSFQLEYRDFIDLPKTLQLIPGFGAIVGATANYHYLDILSYHAKNSYRHRLLNG